jgi:hypothetical protein
MDEGGVIATLIPLCRVAGYRDKKNKKDIGWID